MLPRNCLAVIAVRRDDGCASLLDDGSGIRPIPESLVHISATERQLVVMGQDDALYVSERSE